MYIEIHVCIYVYIYIYIYTHVYLYIYIYQLYYVCYIILYCIIFSYYILYHMLYILYIHTLSADWFTIISWLSGRPALRSSRSRLVPWSRPSSSRCEAKEFLRTIAAWRLRMGGALKLTWENHRKTKNSGKNMG